MALRPTPDTDAFAAHMAEELVIPAWLEFSQDLEREREAYHEQLEAMREAVNEAAQVLGKCATWPSRCDISDSANFALAKLQPCLK